MPKIVKILGVGISTDSEENLLIAAKDCLKKAGGKYLVTPNPEIVLAAQKDQSFKSILNEAQISLPDGAGIIWAGEMLKRNTKNPFVAIWCLFKVAIGKSNSLFSERVTGADFTLKLCKELPASTKVFFLGGQEGVALAASKKLKELNPSLNIAGVSSAEAIVENDRDLQKEINDSKANLLLVAFGAPKQEKWIARNLPHLKTVRLAMGIGGTFDFIAGKVKRAPKVMRSMGLEWLYRLIMQPKRIKRIINATIVFPFKFLRGK